MTEHNHHRDHAHQSGNVELKIALGIVLAIMVLEVVGGLLSNSLALLGDAGHMLVDALGFGIALIALSIARKPATETKTFGYHRAEIMAALANGTTLVLVSAFIFYEAYHRFQEPPSVQTPLMLLVAIIGLAANLGGIWLLRRARHSSLNIKAAFWHVLGDTISSVGVIAAGVVIALTGWRYADPLVAVLIGFVILWGAVRLTRESMDILLEGVPEHIKINEVITTLKQTPGVEDVHDLHIWTITSGMYALSAHLRITDQMVSKSTEVMRAVEEQLGRSFSITHTTLQLECESCPTGMVCELSLPKDHEQLSSH